MTYRKLAIIAIACTVIGAVGIFVLALGATGDDEHPGGSCGWLAPNPPAPSPDAGTSTGALDDSSG